jgi:hypothetical protein
MKITIIANKLIKFDEIMMKRTMKSLNKYLLNNPKSNEIIVKWVDRSTVMINSILVDLKENYKFNDVATLFND